MTRTFIRFNLVGLAGFVVQLSVLVALDAVGVPVPVATCIAVEAAILHNFVWHERWTWPGSGVGTRATRLGRFHLSNGIISICGNVTLTAALVHAGTSLVIANVAAVLVCSLLNFIAAHLWVFCAKTWPTVHGHLH